MKKKFAVSIIDQFLQYCALRYPHTICRAACNRLYFCDVKIIISGVRRAIHNLVFEYFLDLKISQIEWS